MKFLSFLFACYLLLAPCLPCSEAGECNDDVKTEMTRYDTGFENHEHEDENCNPFCDCACCAHISITNSKVEKMADKVQKPNQKKPFSYHNISLSSNYFGNIWQPPKFSRAIS